ncbi:S-adenosyl-L-methionine-dependent methyltransferase [Aspergillus sclerotiicarbonarius CBS 121057]|uniref:catechol O-methyltransferase n=1 Tax=Aspergillus sclerotiicarbonarius (strain CBS 121057 / IBT 28362) TaxID=1448318 RepID=A0A319FMT4_ASPSB|nr:S-adenosyl-L-methionine-dependent methyltransferase [Aspergillus sclerotiicarbonarius CBS 121057]
MSDKPNSPPALKWALDGREVDLLHYIFNRSDLRQIRGNPAKVLGAIDDYHSQFKPLMNVGVAKGKFITGIIAERKPSVMIELGGYIGYSAVLFGDAIRKNGGKQFLSIEKNPEMAAVATQLVELAGLRDYVRIIIGASNTVLRELITETRDIDTVELIFIDHWQDLYRPDPWLLEELDVLKPGKSVLLADNVIMPGAPVYLEWIHATPQEKKDILSKSDVGLLKPNPDLVYDSRAQEFQDTEFGRDGVAVIHIK